jgi:hypothetical protein
MFVFEFDPESGVRKQLRHDPRKFQKFFLCHPLPSVSCPDSGSPRPEGAKPSGIRAIRQLVNAAFVIHCRSGAGKNAS